MFKGGFFELPRSGHEDAAQVAALVVLLVVSDEGREDTTCGGCCVSTGKLVAVVAAVVATCREAFAVYFVFYLTTCSIMKERLKKSEYRSVEFIL
jgi:hypothetical protein